MNTIFHILKECEKKTLYIIGNGFDLFHKLPTSYFHFYQWLKMMKQDDFIDKMEKFFPSKHEIDKLLWHDFEMALGKYDLHLIYNRFTPEVSDRYIKNLELYARRAVEPIINKIRPLVSEWAQSISLNGVRPQIELLSDAQYLTFNYTLTLERVYQIKRTQIFHIHNSVNNDKVVVGSSVWKNRWDTERLGLSDEEEQGQKELIDVLNTLYKNPSGIIDASRDYFSHLSHIEHIVILGHSLSSIDMPYFREICYNISPNSHWYISKHLPGDSERIQNFVEVITYGPNNGTSKDNIHVFDL